MKKNLFDRIADKLAMATAMELTLVGGKRKIMTTADLKRCILAVRAYSGISQRDDGDQHE